MSGRTDRRPAGPVIASTWVPARDGVRLALDVVRPAASDQAPVAAVLTMSRYWRSFRMRMPNPPGKAPMGPRAAIADSLVARGFAAVTIDARGTGASEGRWLHPWSRDEIEDLRDIVDWVIAQPWSNGQVTGTGISYEGTTAMLLASLGHPAVRAVAPRSFELDLWSDIVAPGGVRNRGFTDGWGATARLLDANRVPPMFGTMGRIMVRGVRPVDEDPSGARLAAIVAARPDPDVAAQLNAAQGADGAYGTQPVTLADLSVSASLPALAAAAVPAQVWGSWRDGTTAESALRLFAELPSVREVRIGAWSHTGEQHGSPFAEGGRPVPALAEQWELVESFLEARLAGREPAPARRVHFFTMGEERWRESETWPPAGTADRPFHLGPAGTLQPDPPAEGAEARPLSRTATTGTSNRWHTQMAKPVRYGDRRKASAALAGWTAAPIGAPITISGSPVLRLRVVAPGDALTVFAYLEGVAPDGRVLNLTEGMLDARYRGTEAAWPAVSMVDRQPVIPGVPMDLRIRLLPTSVRLEAGWRVRLTIAGSDLDTFGAPAGPDALEIRYGGVDGSVLELPVEAR